MIYRPAKEANDYLTTRFGLAETVTPHARELMGRAPRTMRHFVADYADVWQRPTEAAVVAA